MSGISIPIGADLSAFQEATSALTSEIRRLSALISKSMGPAADSARKMTRETRDMGKAAKQSRASFLQVAQGVTAVGSNIANIAIGVRHFKNLKSGTQQAVASLKTMAANPALRKVAIGAAAAGVAIIGTVAAVKVVRGGLNSLRRIGSASFTAIKSVALGAFRSIKSAASGLSRLITGGGFMGGALRLAGVAGAFALATSQLKGAIGAATEFEDMQVSMEQFVGDAGKAKSLIEEMTNFATATPFETKDVLASSAKLLSAGIGGDIGQLTKDIAAVSKDGQQLADLSDAVAKGFAKGKFQTEELNKFLERGINLMPALANVTGLAGDELKKAIEAGLGFDQVSAAIASLSVEGGQFFGLLERRSKTTIGLVSTLKSVWDEVRRNFAQPILDALKPMITAGIDGLNSLREKAAQVGEAVRDIFLGAFVLIRDGRAMELLTAGFRLAVASGIDLLTRGLRSAVAFLATALPPIFDMAMSKIKDPAFWDGVGVLFRGLGQAIAAEINSGLGQTENAEMLRRGSAQTLGIGRNLIRAAGGEQDPAKILGDSLTAGLSAAAKAAMGPASPGMSEAKSAWTALMSDVSSSVKTLRQSSAIPDVAAGATGESTNARLDPLQAATAGGSGGGSFSFASSLARIGGGGFGTMISPMVSQQQRTNTLLKNIDQNTRNSGKPVELSFI